MADDRDDAEELPDAVHARVTELSERGNEAMDADRLTAAIAHWRDALALLPEPRAKWEAATWLHASIGDALRRQDDVAGALEAFADAYRAADGHTNPFVLFSLGACTLDTGQADAAVDFLLRAYMLAGEDVFEGEDARYLDLLRARKLVD